VGFLMAMCLLGALLLGGAALVLSSQATLGATLAGLACLAAILARIAQAESQASEAKQRATGVSAEQIRCLACGEVSAQGPRNCPKCGHEYFTPVTKPGAIA